jgi:hypothetical protein
MEQQNTIPAPLGAISGLEKPGDLPTQRGNAEETPFAMKLVFWVAFALLAYGAAKFFAL